MEDTDTTFHPPEPFRCDVQNENGTAWLRPGGELDLDTVKEVERQLEHARRAGAAKLVLDLRDLTFMDSTGLRLVIRWDAAARSDGFGFSVVPGADAVQRVFRLTGLEDQLPFIAAPPGQ